MNSRLQFISTTGMDRETWLSYRHTGIGASEVGAILGLDQYLSSLELYYYKIGEVPRFNTESMAAFIGKVDEDKIANLWQFWEPGGDEQVMIRNFYAKKVIRKCRRVRAYVRNPAYPWLFVSLDRKTDAKYDSRGEGALELKTIGGYEADKWEAGLPPKYITQVQTQIGVCEFGFGEMALLEDNRKFFVYPFDKSDSIFQHVVTATGNFWNKVVAGRKLVNEKYHCMATFNQKRVQELQHEIDALAPEPDGSLAYANYLKDRFDNPNKMERQGTSAELSAAIEHWRVVSELKELQEQKNLQESYLKKGMADIQVLDFGAYGKVYWHKTENGRLFRNKLKS